MNIDEIIEKHKEIEKLEVICINDIIPILGEEHKIIKYLLEYIKENMEGK